MLKNMPLPVIFHRMDIPYGARCPMLPSRREAVRKIAHQRERSQGQEMNLSYRLRTVASFVPEGSVVADIGTDHGYIPIYLCKEGKIERALAVDVKEDPLERAREHIADYGLEDKIEIRLSDGMKSLRPGEADTAVIAGMGGELTIRILTEGKHMWTSIKRWILSPQSEIHKVRAFLREYGFPTEKEAMVMEDGKYYTVICAAGWDQTQASAEKNPVYDCYGEYLIRTGNPVLAGYLEREKGQKEQILKGLETGADRSEKAAVRIEELKQELEWIKEAQNEMQ